MTQAQRVNTFKIEGPVTKIEASYTATGTAQAKVTIHQHEAWKGRDGADRESDIYPTISFFGQPAQDVMDSEAREGDTVSVFGVLGSYVSKQEKTLGQHFTTVKGLGLTVKAKGEAPIPFGNEPVKAAVAGGTEIP